MSLAPALYYVLWLLDPALSALTAGVMFRRNLQRKYPLFFVFMLFRILRAGLVFALFHSYGFASALYFAAYWGLEAVDIVFQFVVIYEIFVRLSVPYSALRTIVAAWPSGISAYLSGVSHSAWVWVLGCSPQLNWRYGRCACKPVTWLIPRSTCWRLAAV